MARPNPIRQIMAADLPSLSYQKRLLFRPSEADVNYAYNIINRYCFDNLLRPPILEQGSIRKAWGYCLWQEQEVSGSYCKIRIMNKWFCPQWFMNTLAHEMVHQWQWDIHRWERYNQGIHRDLQGSHGPSFFAWRDRFEYYGLHLKTFHRMRKWMKYQDFTRC
jgi:hypothetical protein